MTLPKDIPTLQAMATKNWTRPDNVFMTENLAAQTMVCDTDTRQRGPSTDHVPIHMILDIPTSRKAPAQSYNFRMTDWSTFKQELEARLVDIPLPAPITSEDQFRSAVNDLTGVLQDVIRTTVPANKPCPHSRRWWSVELSELRKRKNKLSDEAYKFRAQPDHWSHADLTQVRTEYGAEIHRAKKQHWTDYLEAATAADLWTANKYISNTPTDGSNSRIPTLKVTSPEGVPYEAVTNDEKCTALINTFFPRPPGDSTEPADHNHPTPMDYKCNITANKYSETCRSSAPTRRTVSMRSSMMLSYKKR